MGYLLSITEWQSIQYANRVRLRKPQSLKLFPVHTLRIQPLRNNRLPSSIKKQQKEERNRVNSNKIEAEITGKGRFINEYR